MRRAPLPLGATSRFASTRAWPYGLLLGLWSAGAVLLAVPLVHALGSDPAARAWPVWTARLLVFTAEASGLFYLLGFLAKSLTYLLLPDDPPATATGRGRPVAVLYLTAGDFDPVAVDSLLRLGSAGPKLFVLHDDGSDPAARSGMREFLERHPRRHEWELAVLHRPERLGGKSGAVNWVVDRLDARWDLLLLCDNDSIAVDADALILAEGEFDDPAVAVVQFRNVGYRDPRDPPLRKNLAQAVDVFDVFASAQKVWGYVPFFGHNALVRIDSVRRLGGFTPGFFSDDLDFSARLTLAGERIVYRRDVVFAERHPGDFAAFRRRARKWALGCMQVVRARGLRVLTTPGIPFAHRVGLLEFMGFYPMQALLFSSLILTQLVLPWSRPQVVATPLYFAAGAAVALALFSPTLAWALRARRLRSWPRLAWNCALIYGGSILPTVHGALDAVHGGERPWVPTNLRENRRLIPVHAWVEAVLGAAMVAIPWARGSAVLDFPASYLFMAVLLFSPLAYYAYRDPPSGKEAPRRSLGGRIDRFLHREVRARTVALSVLAVPLTVVGLLHATVTPEAAAPSHPGPEVSTRGDKLLVDGRPFQVRGIFYSPWLPGTGPDGKSPYPGPATVDPDLAAISKLGTDVIFVDEAPGWVVEHAREHGLDTVYGFSINWADTSGGAFEAQENRIVAAVDTLKTRGGILAYILGNEIPPWVVEALGAPTVEGRLRDLAERVRSVDPHRLLAHANWPQTKDLDLSFLDLACFNLYPAWPYEVTVRGYGPYLREVLVPLARGKPLLVTEFGINTLEASPARQADVLADCWAEIEKSPVVGGIVFEWCDEWWKNFDNPIPGKGYWQRAYDPNDAVTHDQDPEEYYGIVTDRRVPKPAYEAVKTMWAAEKPHRSLAPWLVVGGLGFLTLWAFGLVRWRRRRASRDGARTAAALLVVLGFGAMLHVPAASAQTWTRGDTLTGDQQDGQFGWFLAGTGDVTGDGLTDLAVGARFYTADAGTAAGAVYLFGGGALPDTSAVLRWDGVSPNEHFGESIAGRGDVDGDGAPDVAVGAPLRDAGGLSAAGGVDVFRGGARLGSGRWLTLSGEAADDWFGQSVALGDLDGDGHAEIIVGAPYNDRGGSAAGAVFIYHGGATVSSTPGLVLVGAAPNDQFGWSVAWLGDVNGDGYGDLAVGARLHGTGTKSAAGIVYLYLGGPSMDATADGTWIGEAKDDWFGNSVAGPGDVDGGGRADLLVGAPYNDRGGSAAGAVYLFRGEDPPGSPPAAVYVGESGDAQLGWTVSGTGDVDGDGYPDVAAGARLQASGALSAAGRIYVYRGGTSLSSIPFATADGEAADDWFGNCVGTAAGLFVLGRGSPCAGAPYNDTRASAAGRSYVLVLGAVSAVGNPGFRGTPPVLLARPNPARGSVELSWSGPATPGDAFEVVDVTGRQIRVLRGAALPGAPTAARWDLEGKDGRRVSPGVYFARFEGTTRGTPILILP